MLRHPRRVPLRPGRLIAAAALAIRARLSNYQPQIVQRDPASCICRRSAEEIFLKVE
jgi:hypothetical protein